MCVMVDSKVKPIVYHSPIPVPNTSRNNVKAGLDGDVRLEVLKSVPVGEPRSQSLSITEWSTVPRKWEA